MKITKTINFGIQIKIVANMTTESWQNIPHVSYMYEPDVTDFMKEYKSLNIDRIGSDKITINTLMMKVISEGLKAAPIMNSHIQFNRKFVTGRIDEIEDINISMPTVLHNGEMMTLNLHGFDKLNLDEMTDEIADVTRRAEQSNLTEAMFEVSMDNTITALKKGRIFQVLGRLLGAKVGACKVKTLSGKARKEYFAIPATERLTKNDIEQGTVTISNLGSVYKEQRGAVALLEIIPPQVSAFGVGAVQDKPVVITDSLGNKTIEIRQVLPICIAFDHRAFDFGEVVPFIKKLDFIFENPSIMHTWKGKEKTLMFSKDA
ncbi:MAG: 2-oxo acid dehydrogenase subunit E2 [Oscillospiraceae bacterium]